MTIPEKWAGSYPPRERPAFAKRGIVTFFAVILLVIFFVGESSLQKLMLLNKWSMESLKSSTCKPPTLSSTENYSPPGPRTLVVKPTVHESYKGLVQGASKFMSQRRPANEGFKTVIEPNRNVYEYGLTVVSNVCMRPDGAIVMVGMSDKEIWDEVVKVPSLQMEWTSSYNCSKPGGCSGFETMDVSQVPEDVPWVWGTTEHIIPYLGNVFHCFADRLWPHIARFQYPLNETTPHPIDHYLVHRSNTWLYQAGHSMDRNTFMYMFRILASLTPHADFLAFENEDKFLPEGTRPAAAKDEKPVELVCYERLVMACTTCDRISHVLGHNITTPALLRYRNAAFSFFGIPEPSVPLPPRRLRVAFYGRRDTKRRQVTNAQEVVDHLRSYTHPPLDVTFIDEVLENGEYNQSLPEVVSFFSQVDIFITVHGANTWATLFMPKHAAVIEIYGPCGPSTWLSRIAPAVELKHDTKSNPYKDRIASPRSGNTTECQGPFATPDFTLDLRKLDEAIAALSFPTFGAQERISHHWLHNWQ